MWVATGLVLLWMVPSIARHVALLRFAALMIFIGGIGRVISMIALGMPGMPFPIFAGVEIAFPMVLLLQNKVAAEEA